MPIVSVIVPFYNRVIWLAEALESVMQQSYSDFEIIMIDDGSTESIDGLINLNDSRIKYYRQLNRGPSSARNKGIEMAKGEYLVFLDSDDIFEHNKLEIQLEYMKKNSNAIMSHTSYTTIDESGNILEVIDTGKLSGYLYPDILINCPIATPTVMIKREKLNHYRFNELINIGEDIFLWIQLSKISEVLGIDIPLTKVRKHSCNASDDLRSQVVVFNSVSRHIVSKDNCLSIRFKNNRNLLFYQQISQNYLLKKEKFNSVIFLLKAIIMSPCNIKSLILFLKIILPIRILRKIVKEK